MRLMTLSMEDWLFSFFKDITRKLFAKSNAYYKAYMENTGVSDNPLLYSERKQYSLLSSALGEMTPVHISEWGFGQESDAGNSRVVDFWCLHRASQMGKVLNYFIELKHVDYCVSSGTNEDLTKRASDMVAEVINQIAEIKKCKVEWPGDGSVYMGLVVIPGYHSASRSVIYNEGSILKYINDKIDGRSGAQVAMATWHGIKELESEFDPEYDFISVVGIIMTKKQ